MYILNTYLNLQGNKTLKLYFIVFILSILEIYLSDKAIYCFNIDGYIECLRQK